MWLGSLSVGGISVGPMAVVAHDAGLRAAEGLLGRDFLGLHAITVDASLGVVTFRAR